MVAKIPHVIPDSVSLLRWSEAGPFIRLTTHHLTNEQNRLGWRKEDNEDEGVQEEESNDADWLVTPFGGCPTVTQSTEDGTDSTGHVETGLPASVDDVASLLVDEATELLVDYYCQQSAMGLTSVSLTSWVGPEVTHQDGVVSLHHHGHRDHARPEHSPGNKIC